MPHLSFTLSRNIILVAIIALIILSIGLFVIHHAPLAKKDIVATAFLFDLVITFPVAWYFIVIRPLRLRKWGIFLVFTLCCGIAYLILPAHQQSYIIQIRKLVIVPELAMLVYGIIKARKIKTEYRRLQTDFSDTAYNLYRSMAIVFGENAYVKIVASEFTMLRFGLLCWKKVKQPSNALRFTVYKESGYPALFGVILFASIVEIVAMHFMLIHYSKVAALVVSILSVYGTIFIVSDLSAVLKSPVLILENQILLRTGFRWRALVNKNNIASIVKIKEGFEPGDNCFKGSILKGNANVLLTFKHPVNIERLYRRPLSVNQIVMSVDQADDFIAKSSIDRETHFEH